MGLGEGGGGGGGGEKGGGGEGGEESTESGVQRNVVHPPNTGLRIKGIPGAFGVQSHLADTGSSPLSAKGSRRRD